MVRLLKAELRRLVRDRRMYIIAAVIAGFCLLTVGILALMDAMVSSLDGTDFELAGMSIMAMLSTDSMILSMTSIGSLGLFAAIAVGLFNGTDFSNLTIRNKITAGNSRDVIFWTAFILNQTINLVYFIFSALVTLVLGAIFMDWSFSSTFAGDLAMTFLISAAFTSIITMISFMTKKTSITILIGVLISVLATSIFEMTAVYYFDFYADSLAGANISYGALEWISRLNLFSMNSFISSLSSGGVEAYFGALHDNYDAYAGWLYGNAAITSLVWGGAAALGGLLHFRRTDIK